MKGAVLVEGKKVRKWGNSLGLRIPKTVTDFLNLAVDDEVTFTITDPHTFSVEIQRPEDELYIPCYEMSDLLSEDDNPNTPEYDWGPDVGKERII